MAPPKKMKGTTANVTLRAEAKQLSIAAAIAALKQETISDVLRRAIEVYIDTYKNILGTALEGLDGKTPEIPNAETRAAMAELRAGKGEKVTIDQIMAELNARN